jgi:hypothetical protein
MFSGADWGGAVGAIFYVFFIAIGAAVFLAIYVFWQTFFGLTPWDVCVKMETDAAKVQCMEAHYE